MNTLLQAASPEIPWKQIFDYSIGIGTMGVFVFVLLGQVKGLKADLKEKDNIIAEKDEKLIEIIVKTIEALNKNSFNMENAPASIKQTIHEAIRDELKAK